MNKSDVLASWEQVKGTHFGQWLQSVTDKAAEETVSQFMGFSELAPLLRVQGFRQGVMHWKAELAEVRRQHDLETKKAKRPFLERIGLGGRT